MGEFMGEVEYRPTPLIKKKIEWEMEVNNEAMILNDSCCIVSATLELTKDKCLRFLHCITTVNLKVEIFIL